MNRFRLFFRLLIVGGVIGLFFPLWGAKGRPHPRSQAQAADTVDVRTVIGKVRDSLRRITPFKVSFIQQLTGEDQEQPDLEESGEILFRDPDRFKWTYLEPDYKVFLLEGERYRYYDRDTEQLMVGTLEDRGRQWMWRLLFSDDIYPHSRWDPLLRGVSVKDAAAGRQPLDVVIYLDSDYLPVRVVQQDPAGVRIIYQFREYHRNITLPPDAFILKVPEDTEIVREGE